MNSSAPQDGLSRGLRRYLFLTAATTGAAIMIVEILGAKMLAPYLGTSHFVWTAQIGVAMASLAFGYYLGGRWADSRPDLGKLYGAIIVAALYLVGATLGIRSVANLCVDLPLPVGSLLASAFLFFIPLALLAMTGPFLIRVITSQLQGIGGNVGRLSAVSTVGSFIGTGLIGYALIPLLPNTVTMMSTAGVLTLISLVYFTVWSSSKAKAVGGAVLVFGLGAYGIIDSQRSSFAGWVEVFRGNSSFGQIQVIDAKIDDRRYYLNDFLTQNTYDREKKQSLSLFTYALHGLGKAYTDRIDAALCIGVGVGIVPMNLVREAVRVDAVEINPAIVPVAEKFFGFEPAKMNLVVGDGRQFLHRTKNRYELVVLDAFLGDSSPAHLMTREAFSEMKAVMQPGGVLVINCFGDRSPGKDFFAASLEKTLRTVFTGVRLHETGNGNMFFVASPSELTPKRALDVEGTPGFIADQLRGLFQGVFEANPLSGIVLTDDFNPVDFHDAPNRERIRRTLATMVRRL